MSNKGQMIPKVIHRLWLGADPIPEEFERYAETWQRHHSGWEMALWTENDLPPLIRQREYEQADDFRTRYDLVRLELIRRFGGIIIDMDMECLRPLSPLLDGVSAFLGRISRARRVGVQVIGAVPEHPLFERAVERMQHTVGTAPTPSQESGPGFLSRVVADYEGDDLTIFPLETFFSPLTIEPPKRPDDFPEMYAVHHHGESYRGPGAEAEVLKRRLAEAQEEIHRVSSTLARTEEKLEALRERSRVREEKLKALRERSRVREEKLRRKVSKYEDRAAERLRELQQCHEKGPETTRLGLLRHFLRASKRRG